MTTYIGSHEAARRLGVAPATLYAYVSRGRIGRRTGADGRSSLFRLDEVEALAERSRRAPRGPRPSIDVRISSAITRLDEDGVLIRGHDLAELVATQRFEDVAELLWSGVLPAESVTWRPPAAADLTALGPVRALPGIDPIGRLAIAAHVLGARHRDDDGAAAARRMLRIAPDVLGAPTSHRARRDRAQRVPDRLASAWMPDATPEVCAAVETALVVLADHELATSTLAVRVAASVRPSPYGAIAAGLATVQGELHGSASTAAHEFLVRCAESSPPEEIGGILGRGERVPGFGHKVYRVVDPRYPLLIASIGPLAESTPDGHRKLALLDDVVAEVGRVVPRSPNVDLALGAMTWIAGLDPAVPLFAVARIAGWGAHFDEELTAPPVRYRGVTA